MSTPNAPPPDQVERFARDLIALTGPLGPARVGLAVSGGTDSLALLLLANAAFGPAIEAATVDHGLRDASANEAAFVSEACRLLGTHHTTLPISLQKRGNVSARAREGRYGALESWCAERALDWLVTAHHADDQLETLVMRINRGSGLGGLSGIRVRNGRVVRPLLGWRRSDLQAIVTAAGMVSIDDPTNRDDRFDRARLRKVLAGADWLDAVGAARSAKALGQADTALDWVIDAGLLPGVDAQAGAFVPVGLPDEFVRRLTLRCIWHFVPGAVIRGSALDRVIATLRDGRGTTIAGVQCRPLGDRWTFAATPPRGPAK